MVLKTRKPKRAQPAPEQPIVWERADPAALAKFDPATKTCTMNCGKHAHDPRSYKELKFMCDDCDCHAAPNELKGTPAMRELMYLEPTDVAPLTATLLASARLEIALIGQAPTEFMAAVSHSTAQGYIKALMDAKLIDSDRWKTLLDEIVAASEARRKVSAPRYE